MKKGVEIKVIQFEAASRKQKVISVGEASNKNRKNRKENKYQNRRDNKKGDLNWEENRIRVKKEHRGEGGG